MNRYWPELGPRQLAKAVAFVALFSLTVLVHPVQQRVASNLQLPLQVLMLEDPHNELTVEDVLTIDGSNMARKLKTPAMLGYGQNIWLQLRTEEKISKDAELWLDLQSPLLDEATLYEQMPDGRLVRRPSIGTEHPFANREVGYRSPIFIIHAKEGEPLTLYLHLRGNNSMIVDPILTTPQAHIANLTNNDAVLIALLMLTIASLITCSWVSFSLRSRVLALLSVWILANILRLAAMTGISYQYFLRDFPRVSDLVTFGSWALGAITMNAFAYCYIGAWGRRVKQYLLLATVVGSLIVTMMIRGDRYAVNAGLFFYLFNDGVLFVVLIWQTAKGVKAARGLLWALSGMALGSSAQLAYFAGYAGDYMLAKYGYFIGLLALIFILVSTAVSKHSALLIRESKSKSEELEKHKRNELQLEFEVAKRTSALKEAMKRLSDTLALEQRARQDQRRFVMMLSHELRTPLSLIDAAAVNIELDAPQQADPIRLRCDRIRKTVAQMIELINKCMTSRKYLSAAPSASKDEADIYTMLYEAHDAARAISQQHKFHIDLKDLPDTLMCDLAMTTLVLRTIACNAVSYTPPGSNITFRGRVDNCGVILEVSDDGPGVHPDDLPHLFERFYRGRNASEQTGTGLGLALAREMMESQGGLLTAFNNPNAGLTVRLWLPFAASATSQPSAQG